MNIQKIHGKLYGKAVLSPAVHPWAVYERDLPSPARMAEGARPSSVLRFHARFSHPECATNTARDLENKFGKDARVEFDKRGDLGTMIMADAPDVEKV